MRSVFLVALSALCIAATARAQDRASASAADEVTIVRPATAGHPAHRFYAGWPSLGYEWSTGVAPEYGWSGEVVYGPWSGAFVDTDVGVAGQVDIRQWTRRHGRLDLGWAVAPGVMLSSTDGRPGDRFVAGVRGQPALLARVMLDRHAWLNTGVASPITLFVGEDRRTVVLPVYPRLGVEFAPAPDLAVSMLMEVGPAFRLFENPDTELGARAFLGLTF
jgi:hypothetical protein